MVYCRWMGLFRTKLVFQLSPCNYQFLISYTVQLLIFWYACCDLISHFLPVWTLEAFAGSRASVRPVQPPLAVRLANRDGVAKHTDEMQTQAAWDFREMAAGERTVTTQVGPTHDQWRTSATSRFAWICSLAHTIPST